MNEREKEKNGDVAETTGGVEAIEQGQAEKKEEIAASDSVSNSDSILQREVCEECKNEWEDDRNRKQARKDNGSKRSTERELLKLRETNR